MKHLNKDQISLYWNHSHIWGFLVWHSLHSLGLPFKILTAQDILKDGIHSKLLIVPGGSAKLKSKDLYKDNKQQGHEIIKNFVKTGGNYLGFCGGAGFALSEKESLGICPWKRSAIQDRLLHHVSGHLHVKCEKSEFFKNTKNYAEEEKIFPVWFPGRFQSDKDILSCNNDVFVLARYIKPSSNFYMSDLPLASFSKEFTQESFEVYGANLDPNLKHEPCAVQGQYEQGNYVLSYAHLETPNSPFANTVYLNILEEFSKLGKITTSKVDELDFDYILKHKLNWEEATLAKSTEKLQHLFGLGLELQLFYERTSWLYGWKIRMHGIQFANLRAVLILLQSLKPNDAMIRKWQEIKDEFSALCEVFYNGTLSWLYARRLALSLPELVSPSILADQENRLFGKAMEMDGICNSLVLLLESVFILQD